MLQKARLIAFMRKPFTEYITCRYIVYSECYGIRMAKLMKTWLEYPDCHEWYHKSCVRIPPTAYCAIQGDINNYTCRPCIDRGVAVLYGRVWQHIFATVLIQKCVVQLTGYLDIFLLLFQFKNDHREWRENHY